MSTPCKGSFEYPSYECYQDIKRQFVDRVTKNEITIIDSVKEFEKTYEHDKLQNLKKLSKVFDNLKAYLSNHHVFTLSDKYNGEGTCKYISYLLYNGIRNKKGSCDENTFNVFKKFVDEYNGKYGSNVCNNMLNYVDLKEYEKMNELYNMYDKYYYLITRLKFWDGVENYCNDMNFLVGSYNKFLYEYESDSIEFNNILTEFEELMNTLTYYTRSHCNERYPMGNPRLYEPPVEKTHDPDDTALGPENRLSHGATLDSTPNPKPEEVRSLSSRLVGEPKRADQANSPRSEVSEQLEVAEASVSQELVERRPSHQNLGYSEQHVLFIPQESYDSRRTYRPGSYYGHVGHTETNEILSPEENSIPVTKHLGLGSEKEHEGVMTNMKNAFSGFMNSVDPVPVVGVSGGMGALFLLFRYTPVGAFFRGGRGRARRIPSGFSGHFPGGFSGYEEFYDGGFGNGPINISYRRELE